MNNLPSNPGSDPFVNALLNEKPPQRLKKPLLETSIPIVKRLQQDDEDERLTVYSERTTNTFLNPGYPPIAPEVREARILEYHDAQNPEKSIEEMKEIDIARVTENNQALETQVHRVEFSRSFMQWKRSAIVPQHCTNLHRGELYGEVVLQVGDSAQYKPLNSKYSFGSYWDWGQGGVEIPPLSSPGGDLTNVYLIQFSLNKLVSNCPFSVGILLGETGEGGKEKFRPLMRRNVYVNHNYYSGSIKDIEQWDGHTFHGVIHPYETLSQDLHLYQSGIHLNNAYGKEYSFLTSDPESIKYQCSPMGNKASGGYHVPVRHPIMHWCFTESNIPDDELPKKSLDHSSEKEIYYLVRPHIMKLAVQALQDKALMYIPVTNMKNLAIKFIPFSNAPKSTDLTLREKFSRHHLVEKKWQRAHDEMATIIDSKKKQHQQQLKEMFGVSFSVEFFTMFRRWARDAVEEEEPSSFIDED